MLVYDKVLEVLLKDNVEFVADTVHQEVVVVVGGEKVVIGDNELIVELPTVIDVEFEGILSVEELVNHVDVLVTV